MNAPTFDTLAFVRKLEASGMDIRQAQALADALSGIVFEMTATKSDLRELEMRLKHDLTVRMGAVAGAVIAILGALISLH